HRRFVEGKGAGELAHDDLAGLLDTAPLGHEVVGFEPVPRLQIDAAFVHRIARLTVDTLDLQKEVRGVIHVRVLLDAGLAQIAQLVVMSQPILTGASGVRSGFMGRYSIVNRSKATLN